MQKRIYQIPFSKDQADEAMHVATSAILTHTQKLKYKMGKRELLKVTGLVVDQVAMYIDSIAKTKTPWTFECEFLPVSVIDNVNAKRKGLFPETGEESLAYVLKKNVWECIPMEEETTLVKYNYNDFCARVVNEKKIRYCFFSFLRC